MTPSNGSVMFSLVDTFAKQQINKETHKTYRSPPITFLSLNSYIIQMAFNGIISAVPDRL